ncbi:hypothetical protein Fmac_021325 [Flemingia macrophylla]|uniref:Receptor-like serine/threonine-protein kinase n=1 Tax=Flemingia macrophylla TaxID=520843 RepID=A0ABD1LWJ0_9FABA
MKSIVFPMRVKVYILFVPLLIVFIAADTSSNISQTQSLAYGNTLVSYPQGTFELGFFNLEETNKIYLGIRYKNIPLRNIIWVANVGNPMKDSSAILKLNSSGNLVLTHNNTVVWSTSSPKEAQNPVVELLDSGNLVIRDGNSTNSNQEEYLWQSFDYPSDTMLPGMKIGWDLKRNHSRNLKSWKSNDDPAPGDLSWGIALNPYPEVIMMKGTEKYQRVGPWNGVQFSVFPEMTTNPIYHYEFVSNTEEVYYTWTLQQSSLITRAVLNQTTQQRIHYVWSDPDASWVVYSALPADECDHYGVCGANSYCKTSASPMCQCLQGFNPVSPEKWNSKNWSQGCVLKQPLSCTDNYTDQFVKYEGMKVPETTHTWLDQNITLDECKAKCLKNCSCMAYTSSNISGTGSGCVIWFGQLFDIVMLQSGGQDLYIRIPASELESEGTKVNDKSEHRRTVRRSGSAMGKLVDGQEIAVKRLSSSSEQGITEFITEVKLIAKLQHRNLVKLLGCCVEGEEKLLVYEYMVNGSLDSFIFVLNSIFALQNSRSNESGYMAPEYAVEGLFSIKSDVYSFGILLLEIICGIKNRALCHGNQTVNLVGYAWSLWKEDNALQLIDSSIKDSCVISEVLRCIHVSLLCVQQFPEDRPTMTSVIQMLGSQMELVEPKEPGFFPRRIPTEETSSSDQNRYASIDELSITTFNGR